MGCIVKQNLLLSSTPEALRGLSEEAPGLPVKICSRVWSALLALEYPNGSPLRLGLTAHWNPIILREQDLETEREKGRSDRPFSFMC